MNSTTIKGIKVVSNFVFEINSVPFFEGFLGLAISDLERTNNYCTKEARTSTKLAMAKPLWNRLEERI